MIDKAEADDVTSVDACGYWSKNEETTYESN